MMKKRVKRISALFLAVSVVSVWVASACPVYAAGDAQAHIGRIRPCAVLSEPDMEKAAENIKDSAVTVACLIGHGLLASNTGSGVVVGVYDDRLIVATARHVVYYIIDRDREPDYTADGSNRDYYVYFADPADTTDNMFRADPELGFKAPATLVYYSVDHDIAFLGVDLKDIDPAARVRYSVLDPAAYDDLEADDPAFIYSLRYTKQAVNPNQDKHYLRVFDRYGYIADPSFLFPAYEDAGEDYLIWTRYPAATIKGMSGCGVYDAKGRLIGIHVAARPDTAESMSVPLPVIIDEYEKALKTLSEEESED